MSFFPPLLHWVPTQPPRGTSRSRWEVLSPPSGSSCLHLSVGRSGPTAGMEAASERSAGDQRSVSAWQLGQPGAGARHRPGVPPRGNGSLAGAGGHRAARQPGAWAGALPGVRPPSRCCLQTGAVMADPSGAKQSRRTGAAPTLLTPLSKHESAGTALLREHAHPHTRSGPCSLGPRPAAMVLSPRGLRPGLGRPTLVFNLTWVACGLGASEDVGLIGTKEPCHPQSQPWGALLSPGSQGRGLPESRLLAGGLQAGLDGYP